MSANKVGSLPGGERNAPILEDNAGSGVNATVASTDYVQASLDFLREYALVIIIAVIVTALICVCSVCCCRLRETPFKCWRKKKKGEKQLEETGLKADCTDSGVTSEVHSQSEYVDKRPPSAESYLRSKKRKRVETRSIIDMLDTVEWLKRTFEEGGTVNDEELLQIKALMRRLRELKNNSVSEDESDFEISSMLRTPSSLQTSNPKFSFPSQAPSQSKGETAGLENSELRGMKMVIDSLADKARSIPNQNFVRENDRVATIKRQSSVSPPERSFGRQSSSFSGSSLVCMELSPIEDSSFDIPPPTGNSFRSISRQNSSFRAKNGTGKPNIPQPPPIPKVPASFIQSQQLKKDLSSPSQPYRRQVSFQTPASPENGSDAVDYPQVHTPSLPSPMGYAPMETRRSNYQLSPILERGEKASPKPVASTAGSGNGLMQEMEEYLKKMPQRSVESNSASEKQKTSKSETPVELDEFDLLGEQINELLAWSNANKP